MEDRLAGASPMLKPSTRSNVVSKLTNETLNRLSLGFAEIEERSCMPEDEAVELHDRRAERSTDQLRMIERSA